MSDEKSATPALDWLLGDSNLREVDGRPFGCFSCPFAEVETDANGERDVNPADPDEGVYRCALLERGDVWGESPVCTPSNWREAAKTELGAVMANSAALEQQVVSLMAGFERAKLALLREGRATEALGRERERADKLAADLSAERSARRRAEDELRAVERRLEDPR